MTNADEDGLICAFVLDGEGGGRRLGWPEIESWRPEDGVLWVHSNRKGSVSSDWLRKRSGIPASVCETMLADESRPRVTRHGDALVVILRGVNLNPGADPDDMVGVRIWIDQGHIFTVRHRRLMAVNDVQIGLSEGRGPRNPGEFLVQVTDRLTDRISPVINDIEDRVDALEDVVLTEQSATLRSQLAHLRQETIALRRYLAPQRDAMMRLQAENTTWLDDIHRAFLHEISDRTTRFVEDLDAARERAAVTQDELSNRLSEQMNKTMYLLTVVAAVLLPPSLVAGLLGINVGGIPGSENHGAFAVVVALIVLLAGFEVLLLKRLKWI